MTDLQLLHVLDARDPEHIVELARYEHTATPESPDSSTHDAMSAAAGGRIYVSSRLSGIHILSADIPRPFDAVRVVLPWVNRD